MSLTEVYVNQINIAKAKEPTRFC